MEVLPAAQPGRWLGSPRRAHGTRIRRRDPGSEWLGCAGARTIVTRVGRCSPEWTGTLTDLAGTGALLGWDRETLMPPDGRRGAGAAAGHLAALHHRELVRADAGEAIDALRADDGALDDDARAMLRLALRGPRPGACACPRRWCARSPRPARAASRPGSRRGRPTTSPPSPRRCGRVVALKRRQAEAIGVGDEPYDALLDEFEPGARAAELEPVFADLRERLAPIVAAASRAGAGRAAAAGVARGGPDGPRPRHRGAGGVRRGGRGHRPLGPPLHQSSPHAGDVRFTTRLDAREPAEQHRRRHARARPRPLRAGAAGRR